MKTKKTAKKIINPSMFERATLEYADQEKQAYLKEFVQWKEKNYRAYAFDGIVSYSQKILDKFLTEQQLIELFNKKQKEV